MDTAAALERYTADQLIGLARRLDAELQDLDVADAGRQVGRMPDGLFARYGLGPQDVAPAAGAAYRAAGLGMQIGVICV